LRERYWKTKSKNKKSQILDEYCHNTGHARKYVIRKIRLRAGANQKARRRRKEFYDGEVRAALGKVSEVFDYPSNRGLSLYWRGRSIG